MGIQKMESRAILVSLLCVLAILTVITLVSAYDELNVSIITEIDGVDVSAGDTGLSIGVGNTIPFKIVLVAGEAVHDAVVRVYVSGEDIETETGKFDMIDGKKYTKLLSLQLPESIKDSPAEDFVFVVVVEAKEGDKRETYEFVLQRESYNLDILNVEVENNVEAGNVLALDIVLKNRGSRDADENFVRVRIPALGIEKKAFFGDLTPVDNLDEDDNEDDDAEDSTERRMFINIPSNAEPGIYTIEVEAYNEDTSTSVTKEISISGSEQGSDVLTAVTSKDVARGGTVTYDLIVVNAGNRIAVYNVIPETAQNLIVSVDQPLLTVAAGSSKVVQVSVQAGDVIGTHSFGVNVESQGQLVKRVNLSANVTQRGVGVTPSNVVILTVVLAIIFVVLLVVLIVLLSRKPEKAEEFGESYY